MTSPNLLAKRETEYRSRAVRALAGGVSSNTRLLNPPLIVDRAEGVRLWDMDGVEYLDYVLGQGPNFLGYAPPAILDQVLDAQRQGVIYGATHRGEVEAAEAFLRTVGWPDRMRFGTSSTEMVHAALRMARHATGRRRIIRFHGHFHGWMDNIQIASNGSEALPASGGQRPEDIADLVTIEWNDIDAFTQAVLAHGDDVAAVIMEPMMLNGGSIEPRPGYLSHVKATCAARGIVLVFDETITGFRVALGGAAERFGVNPDLAIYGKAMAAGWPCAALAGRADLFDAVADGSVSLLGTFNGNVVATAAVTATLEQLQRPGTYSSLEATGARLKAGLEQLFHNRGLPVVLQGPPMAFHARIEPSGNTAHTYSDLQTSDREAYARLADTLIAHGVWVARRGIWYLSTAHTDDDVAETLDRVAAALDDTEAVAR